MKIYVHHYYSKSLFYKLGHNTIDRSFNINNNIGYVTAKYKGKEIEFIFDPIINQNTDGFHLLDYYSAALQVKDNPTYSEIVNKKNYVYDSSYLKVFSELVKDKKNWIICCFSIEKLLCKYDDIKSPFVMEMENQLNEFKNHYIVSDNVIFNNLIKEKYPNHFFALTNTIHQWNELIGIRWYYEYKNIFEKLEQPYNLCLSIRNHTPNRISIINGLAKLNNDKLYLSAVDNQQNGNFRKYSIRLENNINQNINFGNDFDDISLLQNNFPITPYMDYFMRILPMSKMHVISETWDSKQIDFTSNYLSEKTYGFLLGNIPFISTHSYPLEIVHYILDIEPHPFFNEIKQIKGNPNNFVKFVEQFMENFDKNHILCKNWINEVHNKFMDKINNGNSLLDLIYGNFNNENKKIKKSVI